jgi:hypothetical protein
MTKAEVNLSFPHAWRAEILAARPMILPPRHYVYPREVEEVERGALEIQVRTAADGFQPFLATCALGFRDPIAPTGIWSAPNEREMCAVSGGYAYIIDTTLPERFTMIPYRPVLHVLPVVDFGLLLFVGNRTILAWGREGQAWESPKLSDEGVTIERIEGAILRGIGWDMFTDKEVRFSLDLATGSVVRQPR